MIEKYFWIREPILPISFFTEDISKKEYDNILSLLNNEQLAKAIEFSSPTLIKECSNYQNKSDKKKRKIRESILNYASRAALRPTPFGLFCSLRLGEFKNFISSAVYPDILEKYINPSSQWLIYLVKELEKDDAVFDFLSLSLNPKLIFEGDRIIVFNEKLSQCCEVQMSSELDYIIKLVKARETIDNILNFSSKEFFVEKNVVRKFIRKLIENKILATSLELTFPIRKSLTGIIEQLEVIPNQKNRVEKLSKINSFFSKIDESKEEILELMSSFTPNFKEDYLHVDLKSKPKDVLTIFLRKKVNEYEKIIAPFLFFTKETKSIKEIKKYFLKYYNINDEIPLLEFLFSDSSLRNLKLNLEYDYSSEASIRKKLKLLEKLIEETYFLTNESVQISDDFLQKLRESGSVENSQIEYALVFNMLDEDFDNCILNNYLTGSSFKSLFGRFAYMFPEIKYSFYPFSDENGKIIKAEFVTMSESNPKVNNLFFSEQKDDYYICCENIKVDGEIIEISDILVGMKADNIYLKSRKYNKIIFPTQHNMVNFESTFSRVEKFLFLIRLQNEGICQSILSIYHSNKTRIPRICYHNLILSKARFKMKIEDFSELATKSFDFFQIELEKWLHNYNVPTILGLNNWGDVQYYNLKNISHRELIYRLLIKNKHLYFEELGIDINGINCSSKKYKEYVFQVTHYGSSAQFDWDLSTKYNTSILDYDDTAYMKLYMRECYAKKVVELIMPRLYEEYKDYNIFYIKYADPNFHLRIRIIDLGDKKYEALKSIVEILKDFCLLEDKIVTNYDIENYIPEINRYGGLNTIDLVHKYFHYESKLIVDLFLKYDGFLDKILKIQIELILNILESFIVEQESAKEILSNITDKNVYNSKVTEVIKKLNFKKDRMEEIKSMCSALGVETDMYFIALNNLVEAKFETTSSVEICLSLMHMFINRLGNDIEFSEQEIYRIILGLINKDIHRR